MSWSCPECDHTNPDELIKCPCGYIDKDNGEEGDQVLRTKWLKLWIYLFLIIGGIFGIFWSFRLPTIIAMISLPLSILYVCLGVGLHYRKMWAWKANWVAICLSWIGGSLNGAISNKSQGDFATTFFIIFIVGGLVWMLPNYIYWNKRKTFFQTSLTLLIH